MSQRTRRPALYFLQLLAVCAATAQSQITPAGLEGDGSNAFLATKRTMVAARGRVEPKDGVVKVFGSSQLGNAVGVIGELFVREGDTVEAGKILGVYDTYPLRAATVERLRVQLRHNELKWGRVEKLYQRKVASVDERDEWMHRLAVAQARLKEAEAALELARIRAPFSGEVLKIHAYPGERVGLDGVLELGKTDEMYAVAEVYENDIGLVRLGQQATVHSPALPDVLEGHVDRIGRKVGKLNALADDPAAKVDARVVEVWVRLKDGAKVSGLTNLQVEVRIDTASKVASPQGS